MEIIFMVLKMASWKRRTCLRRCVLLSFSPPRSSFLHQIGGPPNQSHLNSWLRLKNARKSRPKKQALSQGGGKSREKEVAGTKSGKVVASTFSDGDEEPLSRRKPIIHRLSVGSSRREKSLTPSKFTKILNMLNRHFTYFKQHFSKATRTSRCMNAFYSVNQVRNNFHLNSRR